MYHTSLKEGSKNLVSLLLSFAMVISMCSVMSLNVNAHDYEGTDVLDKSPYTTAEDIIKHASGATMTLNDEVSKVDEIDINPYIIQSTPTVVEKYEYVEENEIIEVVENNNIENNQSKQTEPVVEAEFTEDPLDGFVYMEDLPLPIELQEYLYIRCQEEGIDYGLALALIRRESMFTIDAVGYNTNGTTDSGLMQINDCNRGWLSADHGITNLLDPYENIDAGTILLGKLIATHGEHNALMAYQYGEAGMQSQFNRGVYTNASIETLYVKRAEFNSNIVIL